MICQTRQPEVERVNWILNTRGYVVFATQKGGLKSGDRVPELVIRGASLSHPFYVLSVTDIEDFREQVRMLWPDDSNRLQLANRNAGSYYFYRCSSD